MEVSTPGMLVLPYTASSVGFARRRLVSDLTRAGVREGAACDAGLVISELISNALRHATPLPGNSVRVSWDLSAGSVTVAVSDGGAETVPRVNEPTGSSLGGRGLGIVDRLSTRWGIRDSREDPAAHDRLSGTATRATEGGRDDGDPGMPEIGPEITVWAELPVEYATVPALVAASSQDA